MVGGQQRTDPRVDAVLAVLSGDSVGETAARFEVDVAVLHRWVRSFVEAGTAQVTNRPTGEAAEQRDRFLAAFAHETRTPLTTAQGWVRLLRDDEVPPSLVARTLARLDDALVRLAERSRDVELLASASLGLVRPHPEPVALRELVAGLDPCPEVGDDVVEVDPELVRLVLRDLWSALHLPPAPDAVSLEVDRLDVWLELRAVRRGAPIEPGVLQALFEPFDLNDDASGITIGLYLARALAVAHGGTIGVDQDQYGTRLWVRLPARPRT